MSNTKVQSLQTLVFRNLKVVAVPLFKDNYSYIVIGTSPNNLILVDPASPSVIWNYLQSHLPHYKVKHILYTHKHWDHAGGSEELIKLINDQQLVVVAGEDDSKHIPGVNLSVAKDTSIHFGEFDVGVLQAPCHTRGHVLYLFNSINSKAYPSEVDLNNKKTSDNKESTQFQSSKFIFVGDTLFIGGAGMFFQGSAQEMNSNYNKLANLDDDTEIFCGHEYTKGNVQWSSKVDYQNQDLLAYKESIASKSVTIPSSVGLQKKINVFLRSVKPQGLMKNISEDPVQLLRILREMKTSKKTLV